ncbi:MAG: hypothetical protein CL610_00445 [Anaerolineaceae bacterium]|nr:hypothetical protein [Anaerolineaceae bacterium]
MPVELSWLIPERVLHERFYGDVTIEDIQELASTLPPFMEEGVPLIHTIIDATNVTSHPSIKDIHEHSSLRTYPNEGWRVMVGANAVARFIGSIILQVMGQRYRMYDTLDEALHFIADQDKSVDVSAYFEDTGS